MSTSNHQNYTTVADRVSFTLQEHQTLNEEMNEKLKIEFEVENTNSIAISATRDLRDILNVFVSTSKGRLQKTDIPHSILRQNIDFVQLINRCLNKGEYDDIRRLNILQPNLSEESKERAWRGEYQGQCHRLLYNNIAKMTRQTEYGNTVSLIQSSATGKSRTVYEYASLVFAIPFNLREDNEPNDSAWSKPDLKVRELLRSNLRDPYRQELYYLIFFASLFRKLLKIVSTLDKQATLEDLALAWRTYLDNSAHRQALYDDVCSDAKKSDDDTLSLETASQTANRELESLLNVITSKVLNPHPPNVPKLVIYFDEAHVLTIPVLGPNTSKTIYDALRSSVSHFMTKGLFVLFMSTASKLEKFAPPSILGRSARISTRLTAQAPITEIPFDCSPDLPIRENVETLASVADVQFMSRFGRALFWSLIKAGLSSARVLDIASIKLLCNSQTQSPASWTSEALLALLDVQLTLSYEAKREAAREHEANLVANHMRLAYSVPTSREYMRSGYSSEPILAEAAAILIQRKSKHSGASWDVDTIYQSMQDGLLDKGEMGELVGRLLLTRAYMRAAARDQPQDSFSKGVKLIDFLKELVADGFINDILECQPVSGGLPLQKAFEEAYVRFTHWIKMADDLGTTTKAATAAFLRCAAIICRTNGPVVDMIIPILMWDTVIGEWAISGILVQIKRRLKPRTVQAYQIHEEDIEFFPPLEESQIPDLVSNFENTPSRPEPSERPYIGLVMELGVQPLIPPQACTSVKLESGKGNKSGETKKGKKRTRDADSPPQSPSTSKRRRRAAKVPPGTSFRVVITAPPTRRLFHAKKCHPQYNIFIYGCSNTCYRVIGDADKIKFTKLLRTGDLLAEYPRDDPDSLDAVLRMKPFFSAGEPSYGWFDRADLNLNKMLDDSNSAGVLAGEFDEDAVERLIGQVESTRQNADKLNMEHEDVEDNDSVESSDESSLT